MMIYLRALLTYRTRCWQRCHRQSICGRVLTSITWACPKFHIWLFQLNNHSKLCNSDFVLCLQRWLLWGIICIWIRMEADLTPCSHGSPIVLCGHIKFANSASDTPGVYTRWIHSLLILTRRWRLCFVSVLQNGIGGEVVILVCAMMDSIIFTW